MQNNNLNNENPTDANNVLAPVALTRDALISICERAIVDVAKWRNRDSPSSQEKTGMLWALLKANCQFEILFEKDGLCTDEQTIWIRVWSPKFHHFDWDGFDLNNKETMEDETFYLPTIARLDMVNGSDWY
jgi:hypothetical protein